MHSLLTLPQVQEKLTLMTTVQRLQLDMTRMMYEKTILVFVITQT